MKLITYETEEKAENTGILLEDGNLIPIDPYASMNELIVHSSLEELKEIAERKEKRIPSASVRILSPIPHPMQDILCLGLNYQEHAKEASGYSEEAFSSNKEEAIYFSKRVSYSQGNGETIPSHNDLTERLDYENELAVILKKDAFKVREEEVKDYIFGYTILNDVSARDLQTRHKQWYFGKSLDGFTPMGPCIVTADEVAFPPTLEVTTLVNGELRQSGNTADLIHSISEIICSLSAGMTLKAGTIIATGTPKGVAMGMENPVFLKHGDIVTCRIEKIGELTNIVD